MSIHKGCGTKIGRTPGGAVRRDRLTILRDENERLRAGIHSALAESKPYHTCHTLMEHTEPCIVCRIVRPLISSLSKTRVK